MVIKKTLVLIDLHEELIQRGNFRSYSISRRSRPSSYVMFKPICTSWGTLKPNDQLLLSYYENVVSRTVTSIDDDMNGFRHILIMMALSEKSVFSSAVLEAVLAFSAYHLSGSQDVLDHSFVATEALSTAMRLSDQLRDRCLPLAASMLLVMYGVGNTAESKWDNILLRSEETC